jgi:hypothetical protein
VKGTKRAQLERDFELWKEFFCESASETKIGTKNGGSLKEEISLWSKGFGRKRLLH